MNTLRIGQFSLENVRGIEPQTAISLSLDDLYLTNELIAMRARLIGFSDAATRLKAKIQSVSGECPDLILDFVENEQEWVLTIDDLPTGLYRVTVQSESAANHIPRPVHDLFEVVRN